LTAARTPAIGTAFERAPDRAYFGSNFKATPFMQ
jgi:hypothetical protein